MRLVRLALFALGRALLRLRYKLTFEGIKQLDQLDKKSGVLFLPNHPAEIDPVIVMVYLADPFFPRPLVVEHFYHLPGASIFMKLVRALCIPNFELAASKWKKERADHAFNEIIEGLDKGESFLIYPSGHLRKGPHEVVGGSSLTHKIIAERPNTNIVLIRIEGLWGSMFSRALTGKTPDFWRNIVKGAWILLKNGIFFAPRREVTLTLDVNPDEIPRYGSRLSFNQYLDTFYNQFKTPKGVVKDEPMKLVSYSRWKEEYPQVIEHKIEKEKEHFDVPEELHLQIAGKIAELAEVPIDRVQEHSHLAKDLGLDSLDIAQIQAFLDQKYDIVEVAPTDLHTVHDLYALALGKKEPSHTLTPPEKLKTWPEEKQRKQPGFLKGDTIAEAFLYTCDRMGSAIACADQIAGPMSYQRIKMIAILLKKHVQKMPGRYIGIMLPASSITYLLVIASLLARKIPVMINWTTGKRTLEHAKNLLDLETIITSRAFIDRVSGLELDFLEKQLVYVEDVRAKITLFDKIQAFILSKSSVGSLKERFALDTVQTTDPGVVLFTSGTESLPKAVPLSHRNILSNQAAAFQETGIVATDCLYGVLPPFHSFGFSVTGLMPILFGMKVFFAPDPTDSQAMARDIERWKITVVCCAPSFFKNLFQVAKRAQLKSVRLFVSGAERAPEELAAYVGSLGPHVIYTEGYGITECSPIVTLNKPGEPLEGVGKPIEGIDLKIIHPETEEILKKGDRGEVCISGPSVFAGYLGPSAKNPFIVLDGKKYYRSGDLGRISPQGNLIIEGRLKRFVKIGGEMVSLTALEEAIGAYAVKHKWDLKKDPKPSLACAVKGRDAERPHIILYTTFHATREAVNEALKELGFGKIVKVSEVRTIDEIPLTGTGKVHFRRLDEMTELA